MSAIKNIRIRLTELLWNEKNSGDPPFADFYIGLRPGEVPGTWYWPDIDYADQTRSSWRTADHLDRIGIILRGFGRLHFLNDPTYAERMIGALAYWLHHDFRNPNWWHNTIGAPQQIADITLMMRTQLSTEQLSRAAELISHGSMATNPDIEGRWTGANLIWGASNTLRHALLIEDEALLGRAMARAAEEIRTDAPEGIQSDGSFFQHGPRLYSGGYGRSFANSIAWLAYLTQGTEYQFSFEKLEVLLFHILDGLRHMTQCGSLDWACIGREMVRPGAIRAGILKTAVERLLHTKEMPRKEELQLYLNELNGTTGPDATKYFSDAMLLCHHFDGIYVGGRFLNDHIWDAEYCNSEGVLCGNMAYGTHTTIMRNGTEYLDLAPVWDYARIPGTTSRTETDAQLLARPDWLSKPSPNNHADGQQDGRRAAVYQHVQHNGVDVMVADFAFENGYVRLGADIHLTEAPVEALTTTVDQCVLQGPVTVGSHSVVHNGIRYTALSDTRFEVLCHVQHGSWQRNALNFPDSSEVVREVLTVTIPHKITKPGAYAYMITSAEHLAPKVEVLRNDNRVQAIRLPDGEIMAVFHRFDELILPNRIIRTTPDIILH